MTAEILVAELEQEGIRLRVEGDRLKLEAPANKVPNPKTIAGLRDNKAAVVEYLRGRSYQFSSFSNPIPQKTEKLPNWPTESHEAERRFGQPHAKLFPFLGRKVRTPGGPGTLLQVFAERVTVLLDRDLRKCTFFSPREVEPVSGERSECEDVRGATT
jgi:tubulysin polyketide synthase-like protein